MLGTWRAGGTQAKTSAKVFKFRQNELPELSGISRDQADTEFLITFSESA